MRLLSVNIGKAQKIENAGKSGTTGIFKEPATTPVQIAFMGLEGDVICDTPNHGGVDQAVYLYGREDYAWWENELGRTLPAGVFGENLTLSDLASADYRIGDRFQVGGAILEVTAPRIPCGTLAARMEDPKFPKRFQQAERPGLYCRVIQEGAVQAGDSVVLNPYVGEPVLAIEIFRNFYRKDQDETTLRRYLAAPIAIRVRNSLECALQKRLD